MPLSLAIAQAPGFPEDSTAPPAAELKQLIAGKVFDVKLPTGTTWRLEFKTSGYFFINVGNFDDSGEWSVQDGKLCTTPRKGSPSCNEMRLSSGLLLMKRDNGQIVQYFAR